MTPPTLLLRSSPPRLAKPRAADSIKSGTIDLGESKKDMVLTAKYEAVRVFGGKPGNYWTTEGCRKYAYAKKGSSGTCNLGRVENKVIPRLHFSKPIVKESSTPMNVTERYDYDARFPLGYGPMAVDEDNRIIHSWTPDMQFMADRIWSIMKKNKPHSRLCVRGNEFNHCSVHLYRRNNAIAPHEDRRRNTNQNSMKENTAVAVFTIGDNRKLFFHRKYDDDNGRTMTEPNPCYIFEQQESCLFILDPADEVPKARRDHGGKRRKNACFVHSIKCSGAKDYISVAFVFRCLCATAQVNSATDRVIPLPPKDEKEKQRRRERGIVRKGDNLPNSQFKQDVQKLQQHWIELMEGKGWLQSI
jgi:hypothetical protein